MANSYVCENILAQTIDGVEQENGNGHVKIAQEGNKVGSLTKTSVSEGS